MTTKKPIFFAFEEHYLEYYTKVVVNFFSMGDVVSTERTLFYYNVVIGVKKKL